MSNTLRRELWAVLDRDPQSDRDLVETVRNLAERAARTPQPAELIARAVADEWAALKPAIQEADAELPDGADIPGDLRALLDQLAAAHQSAAPLPAVPDGTKLCWFPVKGAAPVGGLAARCILPAGHGRGVSCIAESLPSAPDGEDAETGRCDWCESEVPLTDDGYMHGHKQPDGADCAGSHDTAFGHLPRRDAEPDVDAPARLDAAADAIAYAWPGTAYDLRSVASTLRGPDAAEARAAVAAALARPTGDGQ